MHYINKLVSKKIRLTHLQQKIHFSKKNASLCWHLKAENLTLAVLFSVCDTAQKNSQHWHKSIFFSVTQRSSQMSCVYSAEHKQTNIESSAQLYVHRLTHKHTPSCDVWIYVITVNWVKGLLWCWVDDLKCLSVYLLGLDYSWNGTRGIWNWGHVCIFQTNPWM